MTDKYCDLMRARDITPLPQPSPGSSSHSEEELQSFQWPTGLGSHGHSGRSPLITLLLTPCAHVALACSYALSMASMLVPQGSCTSSSRCQIIFFPSDVLTAP